MNDLPKYGCNHPGCPALVAGGGYCPMHKPAERRRVHHRDLARQVYNSKEWRQLREIVLMDHPICEECGINPATEVHHIVPIPQCDPLDRGNLKALCKACHSHETGTRKGRLEPQGGLKTWKTENTKTDAPL